MGKKKLIVSSSYSHSDAPSEIEIEDSFKKLDHITSQGTSSPELINITDTLRYQIRTLIEDKEKLVEHVKTIRVLHAAEVEELREDLKKKRSKLKETRADLIRAKTVAEFDIFNQDTTENLKLQVKQREETIQELLILRTFLRTSLEWIKQSVSESFPRYNSLLYTIMFSNFGMVTTEAFLDFLIQDSYSDRSDSSSTFWIPYVVWFVFGVIGWLIDMYVSKHNTLGQKLETARSATFGEVSVQNMMNVINGRDDGSINTLLKSPEIKGITQKLGSVDVHMTEPHVIDVHNSFEFIDLSRASFDEFSSTDYGVIDEFISSEV